MKRLFYIWNSITKPVGAALLGVLAVVVLSQTAWAQATLLEQVTVETSRYGTELKLHAEQPIQHRVLQASDSVLVLELKDVSTPRTVRTDFSKADDVRHVIFQPNGGNNLKMTIRGEHLGKPLVQVVYPQAISYTQPPAPQAKAMQPPATVAAKPQQPAVNQQTPNNPPAPVATPTEAPKTVATTPEPVPTAANAADSSAIAPVAATAWETPEDTDSFMPEADVEQASSSASNLAMSELLATVGDIPFGAIATGAVVLAMLGGLIWFIRNKWSSLSNTMANTVGQHMPQPQAQQAPLNKKSFKELAEQRRLASQGASNHHFNPHNHPRKSNVYGQRPKTKLHQPVNHAAQTVDKQALRQNQLKQAMQQYQTQQKAPAAKPKRQPLPPVADPIQPMNFERISRSEATHPVNRGGMPKPKQHAALPKPKAGEPLPANPNVLNFLRDVASYMEQDGDKHRARAISKSLRNYD